MMTGRPYFVAVCSLFYYPFLSCWSSFFFLYCLVFFFYGNVNPPWFLARTSGCVFWRYCCIASASSLAVFACDCGMRERVGGTTESCDDEI